MRKLRSQQSEKDIETYLRERIKKLGGKAYKFVSPGRRSVPDRVCVLPGGYTLFIEVKKPGEEPTSLQYRELDRLERVGQWVYWVDSKSRVNAVCDFWERKLTEERIQWGDDYDAE